MTRVPEMTRACPRPREELSHFVRHLASFSVILLEIDVTKKRMYIAVFAVPSNVLSTAKKKNIACGGGSTACLALCLLCSLIQCIQRKKNDVKPYRYISSQRILIFSH